MNRRLQLWLGVSALALVGAVTVPVPAFAGNAQDNDLDPDGGFQHECGEPGGCAEAGERFESRSADEFGEDEDGQRLVRPAQPRSRGGGLGDGDSVTGRIGGGGLGGSSGGRGLSD
jgi:hypothetical protein